MSTTIMMKAIYISDNREECEKMTRIFLGNFPKIELVCFHKGEDAYQAIPTLGNIQFSIIDLSHRSDPIFQLFDQFSLLAKNRPVIFIGTKNLISTMIPPDIYSKNFANEVIEKPLNIPRLKSVVKMAQDWTSEQFFYENTFDLNREGFVPMKIHNFYRFKKIPFDAYIELTNEKFARIIFKDEAYTQGLVHKYARSNIKYLYLEKTEHLQFLEHSILDVKLSLENKNLTPTVMLEEIIKGCSLFHEYLRTVGPSTTIIELADLLVETVVDYFRANKDIRVLLVQFAEQEKDLPSKSVLTAFVCMAILVRMEWNSDLTMRKLVFASIIHDCFIVDENLLKISGREDTLFQSLADQELKSYVEHPLKAAELSGYFNKYPEVGHVIAQHHELPSGRGFPHKITSLQLTSISCIFILATNFLRLMCEKGFNKRSCYRILKQFTISFKEGNFKVPLRALVTLFK